MTKDIDKCLDSAAKENYGTNYGDHLLEQYKLYVDMADKISGRRQSANTFFLAINTALVTLLGVVLPGTNKMLSICWFAVVGGAGLLLCFSWFELLRSYRNLNSAKFIVINLIEKRLPIKPFDAEWTCLGKGNNAKLYQPITHIETKVPWIFSGLYIILIMLAVFGDL